MTTLFNIFNLRKNKIMSKKKSLFQVNKKTEEKDNTSNSRIFYTSKITAPLYKPSGNKPSISSLYDSSKTKELIKKIKSNPNIPENVQTFLCYTAYRFTNFDFKNIADYYANADKEVQEMMEELALVIIDFDKSIEHGFMKLDKKIQEQIDIEFNLYPKDKLNSKPTKKYE